LESHAADHEQFSSDLITNLAEPLRTLSSRYEDLQKRHADYATKLQKERDSAYADLKKVKGSYDSSCQELENRRKKAESAMDYGKAKTQNAYQQQLTDMQNLKVILVNRTKKQDTAVLTDFRTHILSRSTWPISIKKNIITNMSQSS
jgi:hypothetical protein